VNVQLSTHITATLRLSAPINAQRHRRRDVQTTVSCQ